MSVGYHSSKITVRSGIRKPWSYKTETIRWKATGRPSMTWKKSRNRKRNKIARASRKRNRQ